jgi:DNA-binding MarR family transcriptional regulator
MAHKAKKSRRISKSNRNANQKEATSWEPENDIVRHLVLAAILKKNPIPVAYRLNYVANFYVGPLIKWMERKFSMTRPEWIVLFCLNQQTGLNAQQISTVTGRPKTSISAAVNQLLRKKLIARQVDSRDGRRQVLQSTESGTKIYEAILRNFTAREVDMLDCLSANERKTLMSILDKMVSESGSWASPY